jgi:hypothetical protein
VRRRRPHRNLTWSLTPWTRSEKTTALLRFFVARSKSCAACSCVVLLSFRRDPAFCFVALMRTQAPELASIAAQSLSLTLPKTAAYVSCSSHRPSSIIARPHTYQNQSSWFNRYVRDQIVFIQERDQDQISSILLGSSLCNAGIRKNTQLEFGINCNPT